MKEKYGDWRQNKYTNNAEGQGCTSSQCQTDTNHTNKGNYNELSYEESFIDFYQQGFF